MDGTIWKSCANNKHNYSIVTLADSKLVTEALKIFKVGFFQGTT